MISSVFGAGARRLHGAMEPTAHGPKESATPHKVEQGDVNAN